MDGGQRDDFIGENALTAIHTFETDGRKPQADQPFTRAGWRRFSLAVRFN
jgi:hypothetical protein